MLKPSSVPIQITSRDGATVTVTALSGSGQKKQCVTPCSLEFLPGKYAVEARHDGYETAQQTIEVSPHGQHSFPFELKPLPPGEQPQLEQPQQRKQPQPGMLEVRGVPPGELFVDGGSLGKIGRNGEISTKVPIGQHQIKIVANGKNSSIVSRNFEAGRVVSLGKDDFYPSTPPSPEEVAWQTALGSPSIASVEQYLQKYQNGAHSTEAHAMLESLYWTRDSQTNSADSYRDYLSRYPDGPHAAAASTSIEDLKRAEDQAKENQRFQETRNSSDEATLRAFLKEYPSGTQHDQIYGHLDDVIWERANKNDEKSLDAYLKEFSSGRHAQDARTQLAKLPSTSPPPPPPPNKIPKAPQVDDNRAIALVLDQYKKAYEDLNVDELTAIWPSTQLNFSGIRSAELSLTPIGKPDIQGDTAVVNVSQSFKFRDLGKGDHKFDSRLTLRLRRSGDKGSPTAGWIIESISKNK
jgi:hypothetical protein